MRILATVILAACALTPSIDTPVNAKTVSDAIQNAKQNKFEIEILNSSNKKDNSKVKSLNDNFVGSTYSLPSQPDKKILQAFSKSQTADYLSLPRDYFVINASAYTAAADECGKSDGITASGKRVQESRTLACPKSYSFGTKIEIDGMGTYVCEDRGGAIKANHFDIYMQTKKQAFAFGRRNLLARVIK